MTNGMQDAQKFSRAVSILGVALSEEDWACIRRTSILRKARGVSASDCDEARDQLADRPTDIVISNAELPDGTWRDMLALSRSLPDPPSVIVASRLADERLWAEVLNLGGYDLVAKPLEGRELLRIVMAALREQSSGVGRRATCR